VTCNGDNRDALKFLGRKLEGNIRLEKPKRRYGDNIKVALNK